MRTYLRSIETLIKDHPAIDKSLVRTQGFNVFIVLFLRPRNERPPIDDVIAQMSGEMNKIPGLLASISPNPVLQISTGATNNSQGKFSYSVSGIDGEEVRRSTEELTQRCARIPASSS